MEKDKEYFRLRQFGGDKCSTDFVDIIGKQPNKEELNKYFGRTWSKYLTGVNDILKTEIITQELLLLWLKRFKTKLYDKHLKISAPANVKQMFESMLTTRYRKEIRNLREYKGQKSKKDK